MPKIRQEEPRSGVATYDPHGPFTGNPHDDRPEVVVKEQTPPADAEVTGNQQAEVTGDGIENDVPGRADEIEPWIDEAGDDRIGRARRVGAALSVERARTSPRVTVVSKLEALQAGLNRSDGRF